METVELLTEIFNRASEESSILPVSRIFLRQYLPQILEIGHVNLIVNSCKNFTKSESLSLLLCVPELWEKMNLSDWTAVIQLMSPRPKYSIFDPVGWYTDIEFLIKWLNLDALELLFSLDTVTIEDKKQICNFCRANANSLQLSQEDFEDLDGQVLCSADSLKKYREKLLSSDRNLLPKYSDGLSFQGYIEDIWLENFSYTGAT